jgi:hypothetical protein
MVDALSKHPCLHSQWVCFSDIQRDTSLPSFHTEITFFVIITDSWVSSMEGNYAPSLGRKGFQSYQLDHPP